jgi:hypothetical protein
MNLAESVRTPHWIRRLQAYCPPPQGVESFTKRSPESRAGETDSTFDNFNFQA